MKQLVATDSWNTSYFWVIFSLAFMSVATSVKQTRLKERARAPRQMQMPIPKTALPLTGGRI